MGKGRGEGGGREGMRRDGGESANQDHNRDEWKL